jgi:5-methylcytosine-specific restriction endonuclease McrA
MTNRNERGSSEDRRRRKDHLMHVYRADQDATVAGEGKNAVVVAVPKGEGTPAVRCFRCGILLTLLTITVDRIIPGCQGGTYRRTNIRPACSKCNNEIGGTGGG